MDSKLNELQRDCDFAAGEELDTGEADLLINCKHRAPKRKPNLNRCPECGIPYGAAGRYWPKETMPELD
jgi:hypothetical protein